MDWNYTFFHVSGQCAGTATASCSSNSQQIYSENVIVQQYDSKQHLQNQQSTIYQQQSSQDQESNGQHER